MKEEIGTTIAIIIAFFAKEGWEKYKEFRKKKLNTNEMVKSIDFDIKINDELATLRDRYSFNRVSLFDFSNGTSSLTGASFKNVSMRNERVDIITKPISREFQNIPCSNFANLMKDLNDNGIVRAGDTGHEGIAIQHRIYGIKESYYFRLGDNLVNGCICLSNNGNEKIELTTKDIEDIIASCDRILRFKEQMPRQH